MPLARGTPVRGHTHGAGGLRSSGFQRLRGFTRAVSLAVAPPGLFTPRRHRASIRPGPFACACDASELSAPSRGVRRQSHSRRPSSLRHPSTPEALSSTGITPRLQYYGPLRHPVGPACPSRGPGCRVHGTDRASRVATLSIFHACRRHYPGGNRPVPSSLSSRPTDGLPLLTGGSASALCVSRPARRSLAFRPAWSPSRPRRPVSPKCFSPCRYLHEPLWPLPAGAIAGWDSHPPGKRAFPRRTVRWGLHALPMSSLCARRSQRWMKWRRGVGVGLRPSRPAEVARNVMERLLLCHASY